MPLNTLSKLLLFFLTLLHAGCAYEKHAAVAEIDTRHELAGSSTALDGLFGAPAIEAARYAIRLSERYKALGDNAASNRDALSGGLIALAGVAAGGSAVGWASEELAGLAVAGVAVEQSAKYVNSNSAAGAFYNASNQMMCIGTTIAVLIGESEEANIAVTSISIRFIRLSEMQLRKGLERQVPDFKSLADAYASARSRNANFAGASGIASVADALPAALAICFEAGKTP